VSARVLEDPRFADLFKKEEFRINEVGPLGLMSFVFPFQIRGI
jgi:hypothetical protein